MATEWYWIENGEEKGPVPFRDLVLLVQKCILNEDDLVRPHHSNTWEKAHHVVGLFYMARRVAMPHGGASVPSSSTPANEQALTGFDCGGQGSAAITEYAGRPPFTHHNASPDDLHELVEIAGRSPQVPNSFANVVSEAVEDWDKRHAFLSEVTDVGKPFFPMRSMLWRPFAWGGWVIAEIVGTLVEQVFSNVKLLRVGPVLQRLERLISRQSLSSWFRAGCALIAGVATGWSVVGWARHETMRYPNADWSSAGWSVFPLFGPCSSLEYYLMLGEVMAAAATVGFFAAICLEKATDA